MMSFNITDHLEGCEMWIKVDDIIVLLEQLRISFDDLILQIFMKNLRYQS